MQAFAIAAAVAGSLPGTYLWRKSSLMTLGVTVTGDFGGLGCKAAYIAPILLSVGVGAIGVYLASSAQTIWDVGSLFLGCFAMSNVLTLVVQHAINSIVNRGKKGGNGGDDDLSDYKITETDTVIDPKNPPPRNKLPAADKKNIEIAQKIATDTTEKGKAISIAKLVVANNGPSIEYFKKLIHRLEKMDEEGVKDFHNTKELPKEESDRFDRWVEERLQPLTKKYLVYISKP